MSARVQADETAGRNYGTYASPATLNEYSRTDSAIKITGSSQVGDLDICSSAGVTCKNFVAGSAAATLNCTGEDSEASRGGWAIQSVSGQCYSSVDVCIGYDLDNLECAHVAGSLATAADLGIAPFSQCINPDHEKNYCLFPNPGAQGITGQTNDDMFRINDGAHGFFEYASMGPVGAIGRLTYMTRNGGKPDGLMLPSGPGGTFSDFRAFLSRSPVFVTVQKACYPVALSLCGHAAIDLSTAFSTGTSPPDANNEGQLFEDTNDLSAPN